MNSHLHNFYIMAHKSPKGGDKTIVLFCGQKISFWDSKSDYPRAYVFIQPLSTLL